MCPVYDPLMARHQSCNFGYVEYPLFARSTLTGVVVPERVLCMGQIELLGHLTVQTND